MKRKIYVLILIIVVVVVIFFLQQSGDIFKSQLLVEPSPSTIQVEITDYKECLKFSEFKANECLIELALKEKDEKICDKISKNSEQRKCQRALELSK